MSERIFIEGIDCTKCPKLSHCNNNALICRSRYRELKEHLHCDVATKKEMLEDLVTNLNKVVPKIGKACTLVLIFQVLLMFIFTTKIDITCIGFFICITLGINFGAILLGYFVGRFYDYLASKYEVEGVFEEL